MTLRHDSELDDDEPTENAAPANWAAAVAVSILIIATVTLTLVAGGLDLGSVRPFG